jgi:hypothetical protein
VLIDEDRNDPAALAKDLDRLVPEPALGILMIARGRDRVRAVFRDDQNAIDRQPSRAQGERVGDAGFDRKPVRGGKQATGVAGRFLVRVQRDEFERRFGKLSGLGRLNLGFL